MTRRLALAAVFLLAAGLLAPAAAASPSICPAPASSLLWIFGGVQPHQRSKEASGDRLSVVVRGADGVERSACASRPEGGKVTGLDALRQTGVAVVTRDYGGTLGRAVCRIAGAGNAANDCPGVSGHWHYWQLVGGTWKEASSGPSNSDALAAEAEGWVWTEGATATPPRAGSAAVACRLPVLAPVASTTPAAGHSDHGPGPALLGVGGALGFLGLTAVAIRRRRA